MLAIDHIYVMDCLEFLDSIDDACVDLAVIDPPYNLKKADWDTFDTHEEFLAFSYQWMNKVIAKLKPHGSLYVFNTPFNLSLIHI